MKKLVVAEGEEPVLVDLTPEEIADLGNIGRVFTRIVAPQSVSRFQMREALLETDSPHPAYPNALALLDDIMQSRTDRAARAWLQAMTFSRASPTVASLAAQFGWTEAQVDALFIRAAGVEA